MNEADPQPAVPKRRLRWYQYSLLALLTLVTLAAVLCSVVKVAAPFVPIEMVGFLVLAMVVAAVPAVLIGRMIGRTLESLYLGVIWGVWVAILFCVPDIFAAFIAFSETPGPLYTASKVTVGSLIGGCFGGFVMWRIKVRANKASAAKASLRLDQPGG